MTNGAPESEPQAAPAAQAIGLCKTYGTGQAEVHALAGVDVTFARGRFTAVMAHPAQEVDAHALHGGPGPPDIRAVVD